MSPALRREALEAMKRVDIQKLCKDYGVRANLKTEALIDLLLDASRPQPPRTNPPRPPQRPPSTRIPSLAGARPRGQSSSSVIIHDPDNEAEPSSLQRPPPGLKSPEQTTPQRTKKSKQHQYRLGVGRPVIAGGSGARAVTKSVSISRTTKRAKSSRSMRPPEATITEEPEYEAPVGSSLSGPKKNSEQANDLPQADVHTLAGPSRRPIEAAIAEALAPVQQELDSHKAQLIDLKEKVSSLIESFETKIRNLTSEIQSLRAKPQTPPSRDISMTTAQDVSVRIPNPPSTPKRVRSPHRPSFALPVTDDSGPSEYLQNLSDIDMVIHPDSQPNDATEQHKHTGSLLPGFPHSLLGKRPRDSISSNMLEVEEEIETEPEGSVRRPAHKRAKLDGIADMSEVHPSSPKPPSAESSDRGRGPSFPVFSGREEDPPPPTERFPIFYAPSSPPLMSAPATSSANNAENQNPFSFSFVPIASTPAQAMYPMTMGTFPHPERPTSPSPAANPDRPGSRHSDRFGPFRSSSRASGRAPSGGSQTRGEAGGSSGLHRAPSSNEVASGLGLTAIKTSATEQGTPAPPAKRTMYGTELEGDTRFGDFGVEGVASGFWAGGKF